MVFNESFKFNSKSYGVDLELECFYEDKQAKKNILIGKTKVYCLNIAKNDVWSCNLDLI